MKLTDAMNRAARLTTALALLAALGACTQTSRGTIGAVLAQDPGGRVTLREVPEDLAAGLAGLAPGDELILIDGLDVRRMDPSAVHRLLSGEVGQPIELTLVRGEEVLHVRLTRTPARRHRQATETEDARGPSRASDPSADAEDASGADAEDSSGREDAVEDPEDAGAAEGYPPAP